ncbi:O-antigen/teichoic acid export membrane protein [Stella humosa]|uniref:O-antigen/teichoic acid export membrane protein n=1 Tax=Stella humosa TaxID=94 RepID=A0A3N1L5C1_9PROT|nr:lipopolysaccharide biosynthesis protein [Stella humosa]ROP84595.1 O-antigen/teichoic acid export membrane protein [Stella humosa]BBK34115.1 hypothetical protein STHU_47490 [Stella humosa]
MHHVVQSFATTALIQLVGLANAVLLARILGPEGRGELALVLLYPVLALGLIGMAMSDAVVYRAAKGVAPQRLAPTVLLLALAAGLVAFAAGWLVVPILLAGHDPAVVRSGLVYFLMVPAGLAGLYLGGVFQGRLEYGAWNAIRAATTIATATAVAGLVLLGLAEVASVTLAYLAGFCLSAALALLLARRRGWLAARPDGREVGAILRFAAPLQLGVLVQLVNERLDQLLIAHLLTPTDLGLYVAAMAIAIIPSIPAVTLASVAYPRIAGVAEAADRGPVVERYVRLAAALAGVIALLLLAAADRLVALLYGPEFAPAVPILAWYAAGAVALAMRAVLAQAVKASGRPGLAMLAELAGLAVNIVLLLVLLPRVGVAGAAMAYAGMQATVLALLTIAAVRVAGFRPGRLVRDTPREVADQMRRLAQL